MGILEDVKQNAAEEADKFNAKQKAKLKQQKQQANDTTNNAGS